MFYKARMKCPLAPCDEEKRIILLTSLSTYVSVTTESKSLVHSPGPLCPADGQLCLDLGSGCWAGNCGIDQEAMSHPNDSKPSSPVVLLAIV